MDLWAVFRKSVFESIWNLLILVCITKSVKVWLFQHILHWMVLKFNLWSKSPCSEMILKSGSSEMILRSGRNMTRSPSQWSLSVQCQYLGSSWSLLAEWLLNWKENNYNIFVYFKSSCGVVIFFKTPSYGCGFMSWYAEVYYFLYIYFFLLIYKKSRIRETPTLSTNADSRTDTNLKRLRDLS